MKLLNRLAKPVHQLVFGLLTVIPLLTVTPVVLAADEPNVAFSQAELDQMLAPIALYPDALLSQVLIASTYPLEIIQADRWVRSNKDLKTEDALKFAENKDWDPSVKSLVAFPDILHRLSDDVDWTQRLGDAFLGNEDQVMDAVQRLRKRAYATGNLEKAQHIRVEQDDSNIIIEPAEERVVYVPVYDTRVVYGNWWWPSYPPVYWNYPSSYTYVSGFYWGTSIYLGPTYFYSSCQWRDRRVVVVDRRSYYDNGPRFYTGRSIVHYEGARQWQHDPVHRHGVPYYNNDLRTTYGSRHESYQNDREYREQHRDLSRFNHDGDNNRNDPRMLRNFGNDNGNSANTNNANNPRPFDRSEQVRERLNRNDNRNDSGNSPARPWQGNANGNNNISVNNNEVRSPIQREASPAVNRTDANEQNRVNQEHRPSFVNPSLHNEQRTENTSNPQPRIERQDTSRQEAPRRVDVSPPQRAEYRGNDQRAERFNSRVNRERNDDDKTK